MKEADALRTNINGYPVEFGSFPEEVTFELASEDKKQEVRLGSGRGFQAEGTVWVKALNTTGEREGRKEKPKLRLKIYTGSGDASPFVAM